MDQYPRPDILDVVLGTAFVTVFIVVMVLQGGFWVTAIAIGLSAAALIAGELLFR